ncbi:T9SS-dependent choice-of-anchor J family protein [Pontibacter sp. H249]|uniref:T9SS-dependent choice-of-anchor J family protein n=1 Tax=Pontibacter sp. H249 TaxID=3133420 RepID=UPI0030BA3606
MVKHLQKLFALVLVCCAFLGSNNKAWGQVTLTTSPYTQNFDGIGSGLPDGWSVRTGATANSLGNSVAFTSAQTAWSSTSGQFNNRASLDGLGTTASTTEQNSSSDRALAIRQTGSFGDPGAAFVFSLANTKGYRGFTIDFKAQELTNDGRTVTWTVDYAVGEEPSNFISTGTTITTSGIKSTAVSIPVSNLTAIDNLDEPVHFRIVALSGSTGGGSRDVFAIDDFTLSFESVDSNAPAFIAPTSLNLGDGVVGALLTGSYTISGRNLTGDVTLEASASIEISKSADAGYASNLVFTAAELAAELTVYVRATSSTVGEFTGTVTHKSDDFESSVLNITGSFASPYTQNFNNCGTTLPGGWMAYSVTGDQVWECTTFGRSNNAVQINGYANGSKNNEDWLISPALDLTGFNIPLLSFWTRSAFVGPGLKVMVSTNYDGTSAPTTARWNELDIALPAANSDVWTQSEFLLDQYKQASVHVAIVYTSVEGSNGSSRWTFDDFTVTDEPYKFIADNASFDFGTLAQGNFSEANYVTFKALGFTEDIVISSNLLDFEVSKDNVTYAQSVTYTAEEAAEGDELFVRFLPKSTALRFEGKVTATSGDDFVMELGTLTGSSILKNTTLDVVTWNMEWFGADKDKDGRELGPDNEELQYANAKKVFSDLDADILALQEVSNDDEIQRLAGELGYEYVASSAYSYSWDETSTLTPQKLYFLYKPEIAKVKKEKVLLEKFYTDARKGQYASEFTSYPEGASKFWSSGRLPFMVEFETTVNNVKQDITLINLHTRANSGTNVDKHTQRKFDVEMLKDSLDAYYAGKNIIILGDYNDDVDVSVVNNLPSTFKAFVDDEDYDALTYDLSLTGAYTYASGQYESFLDHMIVTSTLSDDYITESVTIEDQFLNSISNFRSTSSDHMPVSARFNLSATPAVSFTEATATKAEDAGKYNVSLTLSEAQATEQTVTVSVLTGGSASAADYIVTGAEEGLVTVTVPANATTATFEVEITDDNLVEANEQVVFMITGKSANLIIGEESTYTLSITDNDKSAVNFTAAALEINEESGLTEVMLELDQATVAEEQITISVTNGTGVTYGTDGDYTTTPAVDNNNIVVTVPAGATSVKFSVNIIDDETAEENEVITFGIASVSNKLMIGRTESTFALTIERNDVVTGIADATKGQFSVYPNPAINYVNLVLPAKAAKGNIGLSVWSIDGRRVFETTGNLDAVNQNLNSKVSNLANGVYIIKVQAGKEVYQTRLMKN